jgi:hypothetical protein
MESVTCTRGLAVPVLGERSELLHILQCSEKQLGVGAQY